MEIVIVKKSTIWKTLLYFPTWESLSLSPILIFLFKQKSIDHSHSLQKDRKNVISSCICDLICAIWADLFHGRTKGRRNIYWRFSGLSYKVKEQHWFPDTFSYCLAKVFVVDVVNCWSHPPSGLEDLFF